MKNCNSNIQHLKRMKNCNCTWCSARIPAEWKEKIPCQIQETGQDLSGCALTRLPLFIPWITLLNRENTIPASPDSQSTEQPTPHRISIRAKAPGANTNPGPNRICIPSLSGKADLPSILITQTETATFHWEYHGKITANCGALTKLRNIFVTSQWTFWKKGGKFGLSARQRL